MGVAKVWDGTNWLRVLPKTSDGASGWKDHPYYYPSSTAGQQVELFSSEQKTVNLQTTSMFRNYDGDGTFTLYLTFYADGTMTKTSTGMTQNWTDQAVNNSTDWCTPRPFDLAKGDFYIRFSTGSPPGNGYATVTHTKNVWYDINDSAPITCGITYTGTEELITEGILVEIAEYVMVAGSGTYRVLDSFDYFLNVAI